MQEVIGSTPIFSTLSYEDKQKKPDQAIGRAFCLARGRGLYKQAVDRQVALAGVVAEGKDAAPRGHFG